MGSRAEAAAVTRRALLDSATSLLDSGGMDAVTLREVGARAGVSRSAPYRHFADKESLLMAIAARSWSDVGDALDALRADPALPPTSALRKALTALVRVGREHPHRYRLMFSTPNSDPTAAVRAAGRTQDLFLALVGSVVGPDDATKYGALLLAGAHGVAGLELSGHLSAQKWKTSGDDVIETMVAALPRG